MVMPVVGEAVIRILENHDVKYVFGIPGVHTIEIYRGLNGSSIKHVTPRHEQGAAFMADGYARIARVPGVCLAITGPGLTNMITPIAQSFADSIPMVVISTINPLVNNRYSGRLHELPNQSSTMQGLVKQSWTIRNPIDLVPFMDDAFHVAMTGRPGPVHVEIPTDMLALSLDEPMQSKPAASCRQPDHGLIDKAIRAIERVEFTVILAGGGAIEASAMIVDLAERLGAPIVTTSNARGIGSNSALRVPASPSLLPVRELLESADLVLAIGTEFGETDFDIYQQYGQLSTRFVVRIDSSDQQLAKGPRADIEIHSTAGVACQAILDRLSNSSLVHEHGPDIAAKTRIHAIGQLDDEMRMHLDVIDTIQDMAGPCIMVGDSTQIPYSGNLYCDIGGSCRWFNSATGYGTLGYSVPAAIGAALADPDKPTICLVGDGGLQFTLPELGTAVDVKAGVIFIVWNNHGYEEIRKSMLQKGVLPVGTDPQPPDLEFIAEAYGMPYRRVKSLQEFRSAFKDLLEATCPSLIDWQI